MKKHDYQRPLTGFAPIHMPANTGSGAVISALSLVLGFALIWHMWLLAGVSFVGVILASIIHTFNYKRDFYIPASEVTETENLRTQQLRASHV
jgi:cytochrome o ubiquinol oxidase subunit 1